MNTDDTLDRIAAMADEDDDDDLEEAWADLRPKGPVEVIPTRGSDVDGMMALAAEQTIFDLTRVIEKRHAGKHVTAEVLADVVGTGVRMFMTKWREALTNQNLTGLIEIVLEGQNLTVEETQGFVRALPASILENIANTAVGSGTGTHALMSLEFLRRQNSVQYQLGREGRRIWAEFKHPKSGQVVRFFLTETFQLPDD